MKTGQTSLIIENMKIITHTEIPLQISRIPIIKKIDNTKCW